MSHDASPDTVQLAASRLDHRLVACARAVERRSTRRSFVNPWVIAGAVAAFVVLPRRYRKSALKAVWPLALGLLKHR